jgi:hypothetical protein
MEVVFLGDNDCPGHMFLYDRLEMGWKSLKSRGFSGYSEPFDVKFRTKVKGQTDKSEFLENYCEFRDAVLI